MAKSENTVIARYGNFFRGDDDFFMSDHEKRECWLLGQGVTPVSVRTFKAPAAKFKQLTTAIAIIPAAWPASSYTGYNFITDAESPNASEIAVLGVQSGGLPNDSYFVPPADSDVTMLVKSIANID